MWKEGKLPELPLKRSVLRRLHPGCPPGCREYLNATGCFEIGRNAINRAGMNPQAEENRPCGLPSADQTLPAVAVTVCEVPGFENDPGKLVLAAANGLYAGGAVPEKILLTVVLPCDYPEQQLQKDMESVADTAASMEMEVTGGHTQVSPAVLRPVCSVIGIGTACCLRRPLQPGDALVMTKWTAIGGTAALARRWKQELSRRFSYHIVEAALQLEQNMSVKDEAEILNDFLAELPIPQTAVHDLSQGGIFGALREMAEYGNVGLDIDLRAIPIRQETIEISEYFDINPYELYSGGSLLIGLPEKYAVQLAERMEKAGIPAAVIGTAEKGNARILRSRKEMRYLDRAARDSWYEAVSSVTYEK